LVTAVGEELSDLSEKKIEKRIKNIIN